MAATATKGRKKKKGRNPLASFDGSVEEQTALDQYLRDVSRHELITPEKEVLPGPVGAPRNISSPILDINEDSMDAPPSVGSVESGLGILLSADVRKITMDGSALFPLVPQRARQDSGSGPAPAPGPQVRQEPLFHSATQRGIHQVH